MGYKIDYYKFIEFQCKMEEILGAMMEDFAAIKDIEEFMLYSEAVQCKSMTSMNSYVQDKHIGVVVPAIETALNNFLVLENAYFMDMYEYENKGGAVIEEDHLNDLITTLSNLNTEIGEFISEMNQKAKAVSHIISLETKSEEDFQDTMDALVGMVANQRNFFLEYEANKLVEAIRARQVIESAKSTVESVTDDGISLTEYEPTPNLVTAIPEYAQLSSDFYNEFGYTEERLENITARKSIEIQSYVNYMEGRRLEMYITGVFTAGISMLLPIGGKVRGLKLAVSEIISASSLAYSLDRYTKGCQLLEMVETKNIESEATGLFNLESTSAGRAFIVFGEASNFYTSVVASSVILGGITGNAPTFTSILADCGEEVVAESVTEIVYGVTGERNILTEFASGMFVSGLRGKASSGMKNIDGIDGSYVSQKIDVDVDLPNQGNRGNINGINDTNVPDGSNQVDNLEEPDTTHNIGNLDDNSGNLIDVEEVVQDSVEGGNTSVKHAVSNANQAQSVLDGINPKYFNPDSRFGGGFYVGADGDTIVAELAEHGNTARYSINYDMNLEGQKVLDLTNPSVASEWGYVQNLSSTKACQNIGEIARQNGYSVIKFQSYRGSGINYVIFNNFDNILTPQMVTPID